MMLCESTTQAVGLGSSYANIAVRTLLAGHPESCLLISPLGIWSGTITISQSASHQVQFYDRPHWPKVNITSPHHIRAPRQTRRGRTVLSRTLKAHRTSSHHHHLASEYRRRFLSGLPKFVRMSNVYSSSRSCLLTTATTTATKGTIIRLAMDCTRPGTGCTLHGPLMDLGPRSTITWCVYMCTLDPAEEILHVFHF